MLVKTQRTMVIDDVISVTDMLESWVNGNKNEIIARLKADHPGLTAMFINEGCRSRQLKISDVNEITNRLIDDRVELLRDSD